jgi:hypothetical protein
MTLMGIHPEQQTKEGDKEDASKTADLLLTSIVRQNVSLLLQATQRIEHYWAGASVVSNIMEQKTAGMGI